MNARPAAPPDDQLLRLSSDRIEVALLPGKGADIYSFVDRESGLDTLFKTPWGWRDAAAARAPDSQSAWLSRYPGGWQQLLPNAGPAREQDGVVLGYHGEAALVPWQIREVTDGRAQLAVELLTVPLRLERTVTVIDSSCQVHDVVRNLSPDPVAVRWVQHPVFGAPFVDGDTRIDTSAGRFLSDRDTPGTGILPDTLTRFPILPGVDGDADLRVIPGPNAPRAVFGALTDVGTNAWFSLTSPNAGFGVRLAWDAAVYPHAWFWQECHASGGFPWFRRAYAVAVEPANILPGEGVSAGLRRGDGPRLAGGAEWTSEITLGRFDLPAVERTE